jgi:hypothetical protein
MVKRSWMSISCICLTCSVFGQGKDPVSVGFLHKIKGDIDNGSEVSIDRWSANAGLPIFKDDAGSFAAFSATYSIDIYDFTGAFQPWEEVRMFSVGLPVHWRINDKWRWASVLRFGSALEDGAETSDSYTWGVVTSIDYRVNDSLVIGPGISYFERLEDDASVFPILSIRWDFADKWQLATGPSEGANSGANVFVKYDACDKWDFIGGLFFQNNRFRLSSSNAAAPDGVGEESTVAVYGVAKYYASETFSLSLMAGMSLGNEYNLFDNVGTSLVEVDADATPFVGFRANYEF